MKQSLKNHIGNIFTTLQISVPFEVYECKIDELPEWTRKVVLTHDFLICCETNPQTEKLRRFLGKEICQYENKIYWFEGERVVVSDQIEIKYLDDKKEDKANYLKTTTRLPPWLDDFIFNQLNAEYSPNFQQFDYNLNLTKEEILRYLGTYFPRSYAESFCIFDNIFQNKEFIQITYEKNYLDILSVGCGTGGDLIGLLTIIEKYCTKAFEINIWAIDGNDEALTILEKVVNKFKEYSSKKISLNLIKSAFTSISEIDNKQIFKHKFDFILAFKLICEIIALGKGLYDNSYYDFIKLFLPLLSDEGLCVLLDVTTKQEHTTYNPILMNRQINQALRELKDYQSLLPLSCNLYDKECFVDCFYQQTFFITHQKHSKDKSKVSYRVIANKIFCNTIGNANGVSKFLVNNDKYCPFTKENEKLEDAYLLRNNQIESRTIEPNKEVEILLPYSKKTEISSDLVKEKNDNSEVFKTESETVKIGVKVIGQLDLSKFEKGKKEIKPDKESSYIIDTNVFVDCPDIITKINKTDHIILSAKVVDELDHLKQTLQDEGKKNVQRALKVINENIIKRGIKMVTADLKLLPKDFNKRSPDNFILSVALKFINDNPILLTSDNGLQVKAKGLNITTITLKEFLK